MVARSNNLADIAIALGIAGLVAWNIMRRNSGVVTTSALINPGSTAGPPTSVRPVSGPLGIRNNNPGNIRPPLIPFRGQVGSNSGYAVFDTAINGVRAIFKLLRTYRTSYGLDTIAKIGNRWAPPSENATGSWVSNVANASGIGMNARLDVFNFATAVALARGIIVAENGPSYKSYYPSDVFTKAWGAI